MKAKEKREHRAYKMAETPYKKAMRRANKNKVSLATLVEAWVTDYGTGNHPSGEMYEMIVGNKEIDWAGFKKEYAEFIERNYKPEINK